MAIEAVGILGAGDTGTALAEIFAVHGFQVRVYDDFKDSLNISMAKVKWLLAKSGKVELLSSIEYVQNLAELKGADIIVESFSKRPDERKIILDKLLKAIDANYIIALRAGVTPLSLILDTVNLPREMSVGFHFVKPARINPLAEVIRTDHTKDEILEVCIELMRKINRTPVIVRDSPGAILERLIRPFILNSIKLLEAGKGTVSEIDGSLKETAGIPLGPFEIADFVGIDSNYETTLEIYELLNKPERLAPSATELKLVQYGQLGKKSTAGFYLYEDGQIVGENPTLGNIIRYLGLKKVTKEEILAQVMGPVIEEAKILGSEIMASEYDIETAIKLGLGWPKGPFAYFRENERLFRKKVVSEFDRLDSF